MELLEKLIQAQHKLKQELPEPKTAQERFDEMAHGRGLPSKSPTTKLKKFERVRLKRFEATSPFVPPLL
ncbi:hypothetical protein LRP52_24025 [Photobacterium sp. ZSDE20]|uniref:Uncharacterized protein n=1 Tax=Photobacterium pectinilyticum TaxID=2906793 RepID=A0ABT1N561_9GAMM|nr:hypothetical protein [Photobacterium sp. ZSDE20]MCQ1058374.1 hypothetical protein [Photobacterium sp. ZSDE20]MDD1825263.1 hypothetical protein [Photobacterium sp. ZSDE20]